MQTAALISHETSKAPIPRAPAAIEETGLSVDQLSQLFVKTLYTGETTGVTVADRLRLPYAILAPLVEAIRAEHLIEVRGTAGSGAAGYRYALTDLGRDRARQYFDANQYVGPAPVTLESYVNEMKAIANARGYINRDRLRAGFAHLVVPDGVLEQVGPAVNAGKAVFLYGPPGNGKTVIAEGMGRALGGDMYVPHAIDIEGQIVTVFDPVNHDSLEGTDIEAEKGSVIKSAPRDRRWVHIRRPVVVVGGELTLEMLDLAFNPISKFHEAPIQMKANGGVFLVDDFGRQRIRPQDLLNRWIVPLESRVDYLTLHTGRKFQVPFEVLIVFATNLDPASLADEAFLRRIPYKIPIEDPTVEQFTRIFELNCQRRKLRFHQVMVAYLLRRHYAPEERLVGERARLEVGGEDAQHVERHLELLARVQREVVHAALERHDPAVQQVLGTHALAAEVVHQEHAAVRLQLQRRLVELRDAVEGEIQHVERQLAADDNDGTADTNPAPVARGLGDQAGRTAVIVERLVVDRVVHRDDVPVHLDRVRHEHVAADRAPEALGDDALAVPRRAVEKDRLVGVDRRPELLEHAVADDEVREAVTQPLLIDVAA